MPELTCPNCQSQLPQDSKYCNQCGKMVGFDAPSENKAIETITSYTQFLTVLHDKQMNMFKWILTLVSIVILGFMAIIGLGPYAFQDTIQEIVQQKVANWVEGHLNETIILAAADNKAEKLVGETISGIYAKSLKIDASAKHNLAYVWIQLARLNGDREKLSKLSAFEKKFLKDSKENYFRKAQNYLLKNTEKHPSYSASWYELGRLYYTYDKEYEVFEAKANTDNPISASVTCPKNEKNWEKYKVCRLSKSRTYFNEAINSYSDEDKKKYAAEPALYRAQISMQLLEMGRKKITRQMVNQDLTTLIDSIKEKVCPDSNECKNKNFVKAELAQKVFLDEIPAEPPKEKDCKGFYDRYKTLSEGNSDEWGKKLLWCFREDLKFGKFLGL